MSRRTMCKLAIAASCAAALAAAAAPAFAGPPRGYRQVVSGILAGPHLQGVRGTVTCPPGTVPLGGGGFVSSSDPHVAIASTFPTATGWDTDLDNESTADTVFDVRATCARPPNRYVVVTSEPVLVPAGSQGTAFAVCPAPTRTLGGGGEWDTSGSFLNLNSSYPGPFTWNVAGNNRTTFAARLTAFAVCGKPKGLTLVFGFTSVVGPGQIPLSIACPAPRVPLSGGLFANSASTDVSLNASTFSNDDWTTWVNDATAAGIPAQPLVLCAGT